ncbi:MAG TPA: MG2 domain-containing protein [Gemmatimonadaceae bacterium]|nr:MG2 domain-containing protein [Gemmatimonadaceae bacterium]
MPPLSVLRYSLVLAAVGAALVPSSARAQSTEPLKVIRVAPSGEARPTATITVTFDRPVAGSLDRTIDPRTILTVQPPIAGKLEWRDPVTLRLTPSQMLTPGMRYTVTVANTFSSMDGGKLAAPYGFVFRTQGPVLLTGSPVFGDNSRAAHVAKNQRFDVVFSAPVDLEKLSATAYAEFNAACAGGQRVVRLRAIGQRRPRDTDPPNFRWAGVNYRDMAGDTLRRVVQLQAPGPLPHGCGAELVVPSELSDELPHGYTRWGFETYGDLKLVELKCAYGQDFCPRGPLTLRFSNPVRGAEVLRRVKVFPDVKFAVRDTSDESTTWALDATLEPHVGYAVVADTALRDVFGQSLRGNPALGYRTTGYSPSVNYAYGRQLVEHVGFRTLAVEYVNVDTLIATIAAIPDSLEARVLSVSWGNAELWNSLLGGAPRTPVPVRATADHPAVIGIPLPAASPSRTNTLFAIRVNGRSHGREVVSGGAVAVVQVTDLGVHARIGKTEGVVWVTGVNDGKPRTGALVVLHDAVGKTLATARTDQQGIARLTGWGESSAAASEEDEGEDEGYPGFEGYVKVSLGDDRAVTPVNGYDPDLSPWRFNAYSAYGDQRFPLAGAVFTERGIYRPGERVFAKTIVRSGALGALRPPVGAGRDSVKWIFRDREQGVIKEIVAGLSTFGTADQALEIPTSAALGTYAVEVQTRLQGDWRKVADAYYRVAEYRPPEFLVDVASTNETRFPGDTLSAQVQARYLFGAPMGRAALTWVAQSSSLYAWDLDVPGTEGWTLGESGPWWEENTSPTAVLASGVDTLDARGERSIRFKLPALAKGRAARIAVQATVADVNRQVVAATTTTLVHPADVYIAVKPLGSSYFWQAGTRQSVSVMTVRPTGERVADVRVSGTVVRREWHRVRREREGVSEVVGEWVADTVARCAVTTSASAETCAFTPPAAGIYTVSFTATDARGRKASTSFERWTSGKDWVPWSDETQFKMDVIPDRTRYSVGDTATILFASPFIDAEAWITVEREGLIDQRRMRLTSGATTLKFPITEAFAPNVFVSIVVARGRSAKPGPLDDPGRPTIRVGYAEIRVTPEVKRLAVALDTDKPQYLPGDSARVMIRVRDPQGRGPRSEVTLWAVDEGVLALTGYKTPDPIDLIYRARGLGMRLASNMTAVAPQVPEGEKGRREAGGGGGADGADVLRSRFQTTAFFIGSVVTDTQGNATATAKLPDNLTTFRIMAVAVTAGDRYGNGQSKLLVTRPLVARAALPRFVRPADRFVAGAVVNRRDGVAAAVRMKTAVTGVSLRGQAEQTATLAASRGSEVRFPFETPKGIGDTASFRFDVTDGQNADAVRVSIPVRPDYHPQATVASGVLHDTASVEILLPKSIDPARSTVSLSLGTSPMASIRGMTRRLRVYPYYCSEQVISAAVPLIALYRAGQQGAEGVLSRDPRADIVRAVEMLSRRQRTDGGIGYWSNTDWTSTWLSSYAGIVLLDARDAGIPVDSVVLNQLAAFVTSKLRGDTNVMVSTLGTWFRRRDIALGERVAGVDFLSRLKRPSIAAENELLRLAPQLSLEDRARLAEVMARRGEMPTATAILASTWAQVRVEGRRAVLPDSVGQWFYFASPIRPLARVLSATLVIQPEHPLVGPLVESLAQQGRAERSSWIWNTQDYASAIGALARYDRIRREQGSRGVTVRSAAGKAILAATVDGTVGASRDSTIALSGLLAKSERGESLKLSLQAGPGDAGGPVYYYLTVTEIPATQPVSVEDRGIRVERWYEHATSGAPVTSAVEGDLVRVRLKITVPTTRNFVVLDDALPAGLEAVDLSLRTASAIAGPGVNAARDEDDNSEVAWGYGRWDGGWWSPFDHREMRDDRVVYSATVLWPGTYTATYLARATTPGTFIKPPAHAEEMYNPGVHGRSDGGTFVVTPRDK